MGGSQRDPAIRSSKLENQLQGGCGIPEAYLWARQISCMEILVNVLKWTQASKELVR